MTEIYAQNVLLWLEENDHDLLGYFLRGHLYIESILGELVFKIKKEELSKCDTFSKKLKWLYKNNHISNEINLLLTEINLLRNKLAHRLSYRITQKLY